MSKRISFQIKFHKSSTHWVQVEVHATRGAMRRALRREGHKDPSKTHAACYQFNNPKSRDNCIGRMHFSRDLLTIENIAHESTHAAYHRTELLSIVHTDDRFEEWVAEDTGILTDAILAFLDKERVPVHYSVVPKRRAI